MPGFQHCRWCGGKGCVACDAEERKHKERIAIQKADAAKAWQDCLDNPEFMKWAIGRIRPRGTAKLLRTPSSPQQLSPVANQTAAVREAREGSF